MIEHLYNIYLSSTGVSIDTREIKKGNLFFALKGDKFNANKFTSQALEQGACHAIIDEEQYAVKGKTTLVDNCLVVLQQLATHHRGQFSIPLVAITGSNGKTTTKELLHQILSTKYITHATQGNLNNHIGVPLTLLSMKKNVEIAIIEMGANQLGDIALSCHIAQPTGGIIANISRAHIGVFGSYDNIIKGKTELYKYIQQTNGTLFVNSNYELLKQKSQGFDNILYYPNKNDSLHCKLIKENPFVTVEVDKQQIDSQLIGRYNYENIATALCVGKYFDIPLVKMKMAIESYKPENNRSQVLKKRSNQIISDAYNANPTSMIEAIKNICQEEAKHKVLILGDMNELGEFSQEEHENLGKFLATLNIGTILLCGSQMKHAHLACKGSFYFKNKSDLEEFLKVNKFTDTTILIKASRGMAMETILPYL